MRKQKSAVSQVIFATLSPILIALPGARVLKITCHGIADTDYRQTQHFKLYQTFTVDPEEFIAAALRDDEHGL